MIKKKELKIQNKKIAKTQCVLSSKVENFGTVVFSLCKIILSFGKVVMYLAYVILVLNWFPKFSRDFSSCLFLIPNKFKEIKKFKADCFQSLVNLI